MRRTAGVVVAWVLAANIAGAADVRSRMVEFPGQRGPVRAFLARPAGTGPFPPIVMVHERWGLTAWVRAGAERLAARGYVVLAVDVYKGRVTDDPNVALAMMRGLDPASAVADLRRGVAFLLGQPGIDASRKVGAIGWDMGGGLARLLAESSDAVGPVVICSGSVTTDRAEVDRLVGKPVLGIFGDLDATNPPEVVREFGRMLADRQTRFNLKIFPNAAHSFMRPDNPQYSPDDARPAWVAIEEFFSVYLKGEP